MHALYTSLAPLVFNFGLVLILVPSLLYTNGDPSVRFSKGNLRSLLHFDGWRVLYKLSNMAYISLGIVIFWFYASTSSNGLYLCQWMIMRAQYGSLVLAFALGLLMYLILDKPLRNIERLVLFPSKISDSFLIKKQQGNFSKTSRM